MNFWKKIGTFEPEKQTKIILVRHGESMGNLKEIMLGHTDVDLAPRGYVQAEACGEFLKDESIDAIYSSDLIRAYKTALVHAKMRGLEVTTSKELRECYFGDWENVPLAELAEHQHDLFFNGFRLNFGTFKAPNGERMSEGADRFYNEVLRIAKANTGKTILIAAHAAVIRAFWGKITKTPPEKLAETHLYPTNASCSSILYDGSDLVPLEYSVDEHLSEIGKIVYNF